MRISAFSLSTAGTDRAAPRRNSALPARSHRGKKADQDELGHVPTWTDVHAAHGERLGVGCGGTIKLRAVGQGFPNCIRLVGNLFAVYRELTAGHRPA
jgi:hypothetical protein